MENYVQAQLVSFAQAALLGLLGGCLYDLLRAVRLHRRSRTVTHITDALYTAVMLLMLWMFALRLGGGELRLYMLAAAALGFALYFLLLSPLLLPLWKFWVRAAAEFSAVLWKPAAWSMELVKKVEISIKKLFYFWRKYATIKKYKWDCPYLGENDNGKGGGSNYEEQKKRKKARRRNDAGGAAADRRGHI